MDETINQRIRRYRKEANYTQSQLGEMIGIKTSTYSQMERKGQITCETLLRLATALNVDATVLLLGEKQESEETPKPNKPEPLENGTKYTMELTVREYNMIDIFRHLSEPKKRLACESIFNILKTRKRI